MRSWLGRVIDEGRHNKGAAVPGAGRHRPVPGGSSAAACEFGYCWGAIGYGPDGAVGYATRIATAPDAEKRMQQSCGDKCTVVEVFNDSCAALAEAPDQSHHFGQGESRALAAEAALETCRAIGQYCWIRVSACSQ